MMKFLLTFLLLAAPAFGHNPFVGGGLAVSSINATYATIAPVATVQWPCNPCSPITTGTYPAAPPCQEGTERDLDDAAICASTFDLHVAFTRGIACAAINDAAQDHEDALIQAAADFEIAAAAALATAEAAIARIDEMLADFRISVDTYNELFEAIQEQYDAAIDAASDIFDADKLEADQELTDALNNACNYLQDALALDVQDYLYCMQTACRPVID
jgi:hypothetical protein